MEYSNNTPICRRNKHLNEFERSKIEVLSSLGYSPYRIAKMINRSANTVRNEIKRGTVTQIKARKSTSSYFAETGHIIYTRNRKNCGSKYKLFKCQNFIEHVYKLFYENKHSFDSIVGSCKTNESFAATDMVCAKTLYNYVDKGLLQISNVDLPFKLKRDTKSKRIRFHKRKLGTSIDLRPEIINSRSEFGHWEIDTVIGSKRKEDNVLLTLTERMTRKQIIRMIPSKTADAVQNSINELFTECGSLYTKVFKSFTADNGQEFSRLSTLEKSSNLRVYFAHPYSSGERGTNERHNGLIRRFIPKGRRIKDYTHKNIIKVQNWCNSLPRKILNYLTPDQAFEDQIRELFYQ